jgi:hypothetical protein
VVNLRKAVAIEQLKQTQKTLAKLPPFLEDGESNNLLRICFK